ncbi:MULTISPECIES: TonB-dependent receptor plug domain-containing protein [Alteromonas]|jgi:iron complex outermembrane receptor protein|uniref:TonB-dependent receptor n=2 Tax=Alteromonas stellipolaris TaxID=233316 RepID=A0AAW7Z806_9ALTE|nr:MULTISPECIES: TonB-dependent receptor [Alteromonas]AMJ91936.1 TonB-dependent receptor [Alteromonas sp. Mac2]AMJ75649.1 TonB-dependent receptor [Alteromonas stellipolaris]AMJ88073.1 TonB-dependent receptor [Alteromonas sp. Mac1]AMJ95751.1 TonB-dependent receptor [Alteromonas stellipolaris]ANB21215.1 TonB-dependent receptor [Alteromonas stellipolaris]
MRKNKIHNSIALAFTGITLSLAAPLALAQEAEETAVDTQNVEKIAVVGARGAPRSVTSSPVPVDVLSAEDIEAVAFTDMNNVLMTLVPSYSVARQPISDGGTFIRPATLRGMPTDKTLVLVNSKRRHRAALVSIGGSGTQGPDIATIPTAAIGSVEVLRDGAAAQYGSDAIAGVINFQLKENTEGGSFTADYGSYFEGDGDQITITGNKGFALGDDGFLSISAEYSDSEATYRGEQYCESWFCVDDQSEQYIADATAMANTVHGSDVVQPWGQPNTSGARIFFNAGYALTAEMELYAFGNYSESEGDGSFYYRYPGNGTIEDIRLEDGSIWSPTEFFPGGFTPRFSGDVTDYSFVGGIKGMSGDLGYDISGRYGYNDISYTLANTINPSMGNESPTSFQPGDLTNEETQIQADFTYDFDEYILAFGASYLDESYEISEGEVDSYFAGPYATSDPWGFCDGDTASAAGLAVIANGSTLDCADSDDAVYTVVGVGSNGFPGYSPDYSGTYSRDSYAVYADVSGDITDELFAQAAIRYEDYSDFGSEVVYKVAGIYQINDEVAVRSSYGTGFRAPTPGQQGTTNVSTRLPDGFPVATGLFPAGGDVAQALGAEELLPEKSTNFTLGLTASFGDLTLTADYYNIKLEDRLYSVSTRDVSTTVVTDPDADGYAAYQNYLALSGAGVSGAESIGGVFFFQNAFDTVTEGVDLVATYKMETTYGSTMITGSINYNDTSFDSDPSEYLDPEDMFDFENGTPEMRGVFSVTHSYDVWSAVARLSYYGEYENVGSDDGTVIDAETIQTYGSEFMFDIEGSYLINENLTLSVGVRNLFDSYPDPTINGDACCGQVYDSGSVVDWQGGYYYTRLAARF